MHVNSLCNLFRYVGTVLGSSVISTTILSDDQQINMAVHYQLQHRVEVMLRMYNDQSDITQNVSPLTWGILSLHDILYRNMGMYHLYRDITLKAQQSSLRLTEWFTNVCLYEYIPSYLS